ncbi:MAG: hypothetical protein HOV80_12395 [Polyangiaceae bacterium]|nr:hypothetical protein [Polyangiaceae bacterium]
MATFEEEETSTETPSSVERGLRAGLPFASALEASNAAAITGRPLPPPVPPPRRPLRVVPRGESVLQAERGPSTRSSILWFDPAVIGSLRTAPALASVFTDEAPKRRAKDPHSDAAPQGAPEDLVLALARGAPCPGRHLTSLLDDAAREAAFQPPLALLEGTLVVRYDDKQALEATLATAAATYPASKSIREASDVAQALLSNTWATVESLSAGRQMVRAAISRSYPAALSAFDATVDRALLERRAFRQRTHLGDRRLAFDLAGDDDLSPIDLALALESTLPLYPRLPVVVLVEVHPAQDVQEARPFLLVKALARRLTSPLHPAISAVS